MYIRLVRIDKKDDINQLRNLLKGKFKMKYIRTDIQLSFVGLRGLSSLLSNPFLKISISGIHKEAKDYSIIDKKIFTNKCTPKND